jgi:hypothetical protein
MANLQGWRVVWRDFIIFVFEFGPWDFLGIWDLVFGISLRQDGCVCAESGRVWFVPLEARDASDPG